MTINVEKRNLFDVPRKYLFAHCISADFTLGAGVAKTFNKTFDMRNKLLKQYPDFEYVKGEALLVDGVYNLVTKNRYWEKPTYSSLNSALEDLREQVIDNHVEYLAMPKIGCGLDKLDWDIVYNMIVDTFDDLDIDILICYI